MRISHFNKCISFPWSESCRKKKKVVSVSATKDIKLVLYLVKQVVQTRAVYNAEWATLQLKCNRLSQAPAVRTISHVVSKKLKI